MKRSFTIAFCFIFLFILWTVLVSTVDVQPAGPDGSEVGLFEFNVSFHQLTGVKMGLYELTDILSIVPLLLIFYFAVLGFIQLIRRKVEFSILVLGGFYIIVFIAFIFFEVIIINYRPILIDGCLEASYPSSTTMLSICVISTAIMQLYSRIKNRAASIIICTVIGALGVFLVVGRIISGVHWISDIIGGALLSTGLVMLYRAVVNLKK